MKRAKERDKEKEKDNIVLQITLFDENGKYKPISTLIKVKSVKEYKENSVEYKRQAVQKICNQKYLSGKELLSMGYKIIKVRNWTLLQEMKKRKRG